MITREQFDAAMETKKEAQQTIDNFIRQEKLAFEERLKNNPLFTPNELVYSAFARCEGCGAGLAYPEKCGLGFYWDCANVLTGKITNPGPEHKQYPFSMFEIKSEQQPSAQGATTREK